MQFLLTHDTDTCLRHIKVVDRQTRIKQGVKQGLKKAWITLRPGYRKQLETSRLISEIANETYALKQKIRELEEKNGKSNKK